jgi:hypothetical protein
MTRLDLLLLRPDWHTSTAGLCALVSSLLLLRQVLWLLEGRCACLVCMLGAADFSSRSCSRCGLLLGGHCRRVTTALSQQLLGFASLCIAGGP